MYGTIKVDASRLRPLVNTVLVKLTKITKAGGILLPDMVKDRDRLYREWGEVVALGSAAYEEWGGSETQGIRPGDKVLFVLHAGKLVKEAGTDDADYYLMNDKDILAVVEENG